MAPQKKKAAPVGGNKPVQKKRNAPTGDNQPDNNSKLETKEQRFVDIYCSGVYNKAKAARLAGYSEHSAKEIGYKLFTKVHIKAAIDKRLNELALTDKETLAGISEIAQSRLNDYFTVKEVFQTPQIKKPLTEAILELQGQIEDADKFVTRAKISDPKELLKHVEAQEKRRQQIIWYEIELERNPDAFILAPGKAEIVERAELDIAKLIKDKEAGRIKSVKPTEFGLSVEMYAADAALTNLARIHGLFEKDNKQQQGKVTVKLGGKSVG